MTLVSMTGFGRAEGSEGSTAWAWELRSVNGRGLDLRLRLPGSFEALEPGLREEAGRRLRRGNVTATLTVKREEKATVSLDRDLLNQLLRLANELSGRIQGAPPPRAEALLALPGVLRMVPAEETLGERLMAAVRTGFEVALAGLVESRREEGARLTTLISSQLDAISAFHVRASIQAAEQPERQRARMMETLSTLLRDQPALTGDRVAQEVALLAARSDVREELDRLQAHVEAARGMLDEGAGVGRRLDFLIQEFVRETNTLCSKSATSELTATGLQLKAVIEQMREQAQNVE